MALIGIFNGCGGLLIGGLFCTGIDGLFCTGIEGLFCTGGIEGLFCTGGCEAAEFTGPGRKFGGDANADTL